MSSALAQLGLWSGVDVLFSCALLVSCVLVARPLFAMAVLHSCHLLVPCSVQDMACRGLMRQPEGEQGGRPWSAGVGSTHGGNASFLVVAHTPIHGSHNEDVFRFGLSVQQRGGGDFSCQTERHGV